MMMTWRGVLTHRMFPIKLHEFDWHIGTLDRDFLKRLLTSVAD